MALVTVLPTILQNSCCWSLFWSLFLNKDMIELSVRACLFLGVSISLMTARASWRVCLAMAFFKTHYTDSNLWSGNANSSPSNSITSRLSSSLVPLRDLRFSSGVIHWTSWRQVIQSHLSAVHDEDDLSRVEFGDAQRFADLDLFWLVEAALHGRRQQSQTGFSPCMMPRSRELRPQP